MAKPARRWTEVAGKTPGGEAVVFGAQCLTRDGELWLLLRDNSSEARLHESFRLTLQKERDRQQELEREVARRIRDHEDDLAQFSEITQLGAEVVIGFIEEARELVTYAASLLSQVKPGAVLEPSLLTELGRAFHTIKGNAKSMGLNLLGGRAHHAEELLVPLRRSATCGPERLEEVTALVQDLHRLVDRASELHGLLATGAGADLIPRTRALVRLCNAVDELLGGRGAHQLAPDLASTLRDALEHAELTVSVPVGELLERVARVVRLSAKDLQKPVEVQINLRGSGELRRRAALVAESALGHLARNAVAHGVEDGRWRQAGKKPPVGLVTLWGGARRDGEGYVLGVDDDGAGIDPARVLAAAKERGLVGAGVAHLGTAEAIELLKRPGFTTAAEVTMVAGRGVGLDAVESMARELGGTLEIDTTLGRGTSMRLVLPTSALQPEAPLPHKPEEA